MTANKIKVGSSKPLLLSFLQLTNKYISMDVDFLK